MTQIPSFAQLIKQAIDGRLLDVHTALIAKVESYDADKQLVNVSPILKRSLMTMDGDVVSEDLPVLCDVPVLFPRAGGFFISFPIQPGDFVQLIFNEVDLEEWLDDKEPTIGHNQRFTLQGAVAIPGIYPQAKALLDAHKTNFVLGKEQGLQIHIDDEKIRLWSDDAAEALAIARIVKDELDRLRNAILSHSHVSHGKPTDFWLTPINDVATKKTVAL
jgi:hypothetical protein